MNIVREKKATKLIEEIFEATRLSNKRKSKQLTVRLCRYYSDTRNFQVNGPSCLIETGDLNDDKELISRGIDIGEAAQSTILKDNQAYSHISYNIGNGYYCLFKVDRRNGAVANYYDYIPLQKAKWYFRRALEFETGSSQLRMQANVNLANVYDTVGRVVESIHAYEKILKIDQNFAMAEANLGQALLSFANVCGMYRESTLVQAYKLIRSALGKEKYILQIGGDPAFRFFNSQCEYIRQLFSDKAVLEDDSDHPSIDLQKRTRIEREYIQFCSANKLFLNFHIHFSEIVCVASISDSLMITLVEKIKEESRFKHLAKYINQIKEDYATARFLIFQYGNRQPRINRISKLTSYADTLDYAENNLYLGILKSSFSKAYSILDKIGVFLDEYIGLKTKGKIYFNSIWARKEEGAWIANTKISKYKHQSLLGLYDIYLDFRSGEYEKITKIRNALMHQRLTVVSEFFAFALDRNNAEMEIIDSDFVKQTIELLMIVKSAICNLILFVNNNEEEKRHGRIAMPMFVFDQEQDL